MKHTKKSLLCLTVLSALTLGSCGPDKDGILNPTTGDFFTKEGETVYNGLKNRERTGTYRVFETYFYATLNYTTTMQAEDSKTIANIVDGLVEVNKYGKIVPALASSWESNADKSEFTFTIRENVPWVLYDGKQYKANGQDQFVKAEDWITTLKINLEVANGSESSYLPAMFIKGADEFQYYTSLAYKRANGSGVIEAGKLAAFIAAEKAKLTGLTGDDLAAQEKKIVSIEANCIAGGVSSPKGLCFPGADKALFTDDYIGKVLGAGFRDDKVAYTAAEVKKIANFENVGAKVKDGKLVFTLQGSKPYFLSVLTYNPFLPTNQSFYDEYGSDFGTSYDTVNYCGAFIIPKHEQGTGKTLTYVKNQSYWDKDNVKLDTVISKLIDGTTFGDSSAREAYEGGDIDGFVVSEKDVDGFKKYVTGADGKGTIDNPVNPDAYVNVGKGDGGNFFFSLNNDRDPKRDVSSKTVFPGVDADGNNKAVVNSNKALKNKNLRKAILGGLDYETYFVRYGNTKQQRERLALNTFVPRYFITDDKTGDDYADFFVKEFAAKKNISVADAAARLENSHISQGEGDAKAPAGFGRTPVESKKLLDAAVKELGSTVTYPVQLEYIILAGTIEDKKNEIQFVEMSNYNINGCWSGTTTAPTGAKVCVAGEEKVQIKINGDMADNAEYAANTSQILGATLLVSGWGPDYSDPLTFMNTATTNGDLCNYFGVCKTGDAEHDASIKETMKEYDRLVDVANAITSDSTARLEAFAAAEYELLENVAILRPLQQRGLGKSVVVNKVLPYRATTAPYGINNYSYKGVEVLKKNLTRDERASLKAEFDTLKAK